MMVKGEMVRRFVGADREALRRAARYLCERGSRGDDAGVCALREWLVVVPGARAGRLFLRALLLEADAARLVVDAPHVATSGRIVEELFVPPIAEVDDAIRAAPATPLERAIAWLRALRRAPSEIASVLVDELDAPGVDRTTNHPWWRLARHGVRLEDELQSAGRCFVDLAASVEQRGGDPIRARAFAEVAGIAEEELARAGLCSPHAERRQRLAHGHLRFPHVTMVGVLELGALQRRAVSACPDVHVLVAADEEREKLFDEYGCAREEWNDVVPDLSDDQIVTAESPRDQVERALVFVSELCAQDATLPCDDVAIGVADEALADGLVIAGRDAGLVVHDAGGRPLLATPPGRFLSALAAWQRERHAADLATLVRLPVVEEFVGAAGGEGSALIAALDRLRATRLPARFVAGDAGALEQFGLPDDDVRAVIDAVTALDALAHGASTGAGIVALLHRLPWEESARDAVDELTSMVLAIAAIPLPLLAGGDHPGTLSLCVEEAARHRVPSEPRDPSVEAIGWLELLFEPASHLVVIGMNEGRVPEGPATDPLLTESMRTALGLPTRRTRAARDSVILESMRRRSTSLLLVAGRVDVDGAPLQPSRLLLRAPDAALVSRVERLFDPAQALAGSRAWRRCGSDVSQFVVPPVPDDARNLTAMRVTAFKEYLASPYRFWLRHIERLEEIEDDARELAPPDLGTIVHDLLRDAARDGVFDHARGCDVLADELRRRHEAAARAAFGAHPVPVVRLQLLAMRPRIEAFARWQNEALERGWRVHAVEQPLPDDASITGLPPMKIRGRIDRIDWHEATRTWRLIDFKTGDAGEDPRATHLRGRTEPRWVDLQLPLYGYAMGPLLAETKPDSTLQLGYVRLPADDRLSGWVDSGFTDAERSAAVDVARDVVRRVRAGEFPIGDERPARDPFEMILQTPVFKDASESAFAGEEE